MKFNFSVFTFFLALISVPAVGQQPVRPQSRTQLQPQVQPQPKSQPQSQFQAQPQPQSQSQTLPQTKPLPIAIGTQPKSQPPKGVTILNWRKPGSEQLTEDAPAVKYLNFDGAVFNAKFLGMPMFFKRIQLNAGINHVIISLVNPVYEPLTSAEVAIVKSSSSITSDIKLDYAVVLLQKEPYAHLTFIPIRKNPGTGVYEKLVSFSLDVKQSREESAVRNIKHSHSALFAASSVLASGKWYKIGLTKDGVYKLDYNLFKRMGFKMDSLLPKNIRIYGNGGYMLPDSNKAERDDDLVENAIYVHGQNDTAFNKNDYVLFYGQGPTKWQYSKTDNKYHHTVNLYSDTTYYFITASLGAGKRIGGEAEFAGSPTSTVTSFDDYDYHELDGLNLIQSGYEWFGEYFDATNSYSFSFNFPNIDASSPACATAVVASRYNTPPPPTPDSSYYTISTPSSSTTFGAVGVTTSCYYCQYAALGSGTSCFTPTSSVFQVTVTKVTADAIGWLYYLEVNARRQLTLSNDQMEFRDMKSAGPGNTALFKVAYPTANIRVWDVTHPEQVDSLALQYSSGSNQFALHTDSLRQFVAFNGNSYDSVTYFGVVPNQNLHAMPQADLVIVTNPEFLQEAQQLGDFHTSQDKMAVNVVTSQQVYNEFSSGRQDPVAIRDFMRMLYTRSTSYATRPKYLLIFGDASYDPKHRLPNNTDFVVTYESQESFTPYISYVSDDYFALLDSNEGPLSGNYTLDVGVGRFPCDNISEAQALVSKVKEYETPSGEPATNATSCCNQQTQYNLGGWKNTICFIAHDGDNGIHEGYTGQGADQLAQFVNATYPNINVNKIYCDAYQEVQTPGGPRYPEVNTAIDDQMNQGLLIINYTGHGGPLGLAAQRILGFGDINSWTNASKLSLFFTASCSFAPFDNPFQESAGELCVMLPTGGNIALMTTTRETFSGDNNVVNTEFYQYLYTRLPDGTLPRIGDLFTNSKNASNPSTEIMFTLMGDPAVRLAYPPQKVYTTKINSKSVGANADTLKAFSKVTVSGYVGDTAGNTLTSFNGVLYPTIYDKPDSVTTLVNPSPTINVPFTFALQKNILYRGRISVTNGNFSFTFVVPKDINYKYGLGKISYYAQNGSTDATGNYQNIMIGGSLPNIVNNGKGPQTRLYINDSNFVFDGTTNENPQLFAIVFDSDGINTTGNGLGHDITAVLDNNTQNTYDVTNYYQPALNSYQKGTITYPFTSLPSGKHSLSLRVWNVYNNSSQAYTEFNVQPQSSLKLNHVLNYPNPFTTHTQFFFEINEVCDLMDVQIQIFTVAGKLVRNILTSVKTDSFRSQPIDWDGRDDYGDKIANGVYIYHLKVRTSDGTIADTYQKLVIL